MRHERRWIVAVLVCVITSALLFRTLPARAEGPSEDAIAAWIKGQIKDGRLQVEFYDPAKPPKPFPGWTDFEFRLVYQYDYRIAMHTKKKQKIGTIEIRPKFTRIDIPVKNRTLLPNSLEGDRWHQAALAKHELEHVRVGLHPRLVLLARRLIEKIDVIEVPAASLSEATPEWIGQHVDEAVTVRKDAIQALVARINAKIDSVTKHGAMAFPDWDVFLESLYLKENLDEMKFPYLPEVLDLIESPEYKKVRVVIPEPVDKVQSPVNIKSTEKR